MFVLIQYLFHKYSHDPGYKNEWKLTVNTLCFNLTEHRGPGVAQWLRHWATSWTVPGSIPGAVTGFFSDIFLLTIPWPWSGLSP